MSSGSPKESPLDHALLAYQRGDSALAEQLCRELVQTQPQDDQASLTLSGLLLHRQAFTEAQQVLHDALLHHPEHARLLVNQSLAMRGTGQIDLAVELAQRACTVEPDLLSGWNALGIALLESERFEDAETSLRKGLEHHPDDARLMHHLSQAVEAQGRQAQTMEFRYALAQAGSSKGREAAAKVSRGQFGLAEPAYREAIRLYPEDAASHAGLGCLLLRLGRSEEAVACLERALELAPDDAVSQHFLAAARGDNHPHATAEYVRNLFDSYAGQFDQHLVDQLAYRVPEDLARLLDQRFPDGLGDVLDLGCGTGLVGECVANQSNAVDGVDLSSEMLSKAREKGCYRDLHLADIGQFARQAGRRQWRTVVAADVFIYFGDVGGLFQHLGLCMEAGGRLAFSVESSAEDGLTLNPASGRYQHGRNYLVEALEAADFQAIEFVDTIIRSELGQPIPGWLVIAQRV